MKYSIISISLFPGYGTVGIASAFFIPNTKTSFLSSQNYYHKHVLHTQAVIANPTKLQAGSSDTNADTTPPLPDTSDPFLILNLKEPTADKKVIKRAYKRMALKYHPDVRTNSNSSDAERKQSNDDFARINAAYAFLTGKSDERPDATESEKRRGQTGGTSSSRSGSGYTPPHRRTTDYASDDWRDYMPKYDDDEKYDTNGDSFTSIFSDLFNEFGAAAYKSGGLGGGAKIMNDFISFFENDFDLSGTGSAKEKEEDIILESLLRDGGIEEIENELDDAKKLVKQLETKEMDLDSESLIITKEKEALGDSSRSYMEELGLEERKREVEARKTVVLEYLDRARFRQIKLRKKFDELRSEERGTSNNAYNRNRTSDSGSHSASTEDVSAERGEKSDDDAWKRESFGSSRRRGSGRGRRSSSSSDRTNASTPKNNSEASSTTNNTVEEKQSDDDAWKRESYGSSRSRGSGRGSRSRASSSSSSSKDRVNTGRSSSYTPSSPRSTGADTNNLPPHRRLTTSTFESRVAEDKRRLNDIKVDEEIDKMKKELGL